MQALWDDIRIALTTNSSIRINYKNWDRGLITIDEVRTGKI